MAADAAAADATVQLFVAAMHAIGWMYLAGGMRYERTKFSSERFVFRCAMTAFLFFLFQSYSSFSGFFLFFCSNRVFFLLIIRRENAKKKKKENQ